VISRFFVDRPIFAAVLSILVFLSGAIALTGLSVAQYPDITPPTVLVTASYPGANAQTVLDTVAAPIEQQVSGVENMIYMSSQCTNDGQYNLMVTFKLGMNANMAQVLTQNRVSLAQPNVPDLVQREGIAVKKISPSTMMIVNLTSRRDPATGAPMRDDVYLSNYATIQIRDELLRLPGVADVTYLGRRDYSMRAWLDPEKLASLGLTAESVVAALSQQNLQVAAGSVGQQPVPAGQQQQLVINTLGRLTDVEQFGAVIVKVGEGGPLGQTAGVVRLRDVARVELGAQQYDQTCTLDGEPSVALSIFQLPGSNALDTARGVYARMKELAEHFPPGLQYEIVYDTTPFIEESIVEVFKTLRDAVVLVAVVVLVFLQNWRATLIPLIAVPVAIVGTFAVMSAFNFSLNNLSLFGLVLAIGIVVDDAIVVVENVERWLEHGLPPKEAARKAMDEVTGPVVAVALVLCAVFVPCAFIGGITGQFFKQFAVTIAASTVLSMFNSLTLSPALAAILLRHRPKGSFDFSTFALFVAVGAALPLYFHFTGAAERPWSWWWTWLVVAPAGGAAGAATFLVFDRLFNFGTSVYTGAVGVLLRLSIVVLVVYGGLLYLTYWDFTRTPTGFIPAQDKGYLLVNVQLPDSASVQRTQEVVAQLDEIVRALPGVAHTVGVSGQSLLLAANAPNYGSMNVVLKPFEDRRGPGMSAEEIAEKIRRACRKYVRDALVSVVGPPPVDGLGTSGGFKLMIEDRGPLGVQALQQYSDRVAAAAGERAELQGLFTNTRADTPWLYLDIDREKCLSLGVPLGEVFTALQIYFGSYYVNNFNEFGRSWQVNVQADEPFRNRIEEIGNLKVKNARGQMVPLSSIARVQDSTGPVLLMRYNTYSAAAVFGKPAPGTSSGQAIDRMKEVCARELPVAMASEWTELTYLQLEAGNTAMFVFGLSVVFVFLVLAAQYESWSLPLAVILVVPTCLLCSVVGLNLKGADVNVFPQIGFVVLVGLASKNAILIVEFAKQQREEGRPRRQATLEACRLRLRPILMTSFAFILGVVPLVVAEGAGAEMRRSLGLAVFSGMLGVTFFGIFLTPVFFDVIGWLGDRKGKAPLRGGVFAGPAPEPPTPAKPAAQTPPAEQTGIRTAPDESVR
jgi:multidrug efflux pump